MAKSNQGHLDILKQGIEAWNEWRQENLSLRLDFMGADLSGMNLSGLNFRNADMSRTMLGSADLSGADLSNTRLWKASLRHANLSHACLKDAYLYGARLQHTNLNHSFCEGATFARAYLNGATLRNADFSVANFNGTDLSGADLSGSKLISSTFVSTNLTGANLTGCSIFGISAWGVVLHNTKQENLLITSKGQPVITVDNLNVAQFIYLLLNNAEIRDIIDTTAKKAVLILGRFTRGRKIILEALKEALRTYEYVPILFDFDKPSSEDLTETVSILAHLSRFIIVDLTDPSSVPYEVGTIASNHIRPIQAIFHPTNEAKRVFAMFGDIRRRYDWVLPPFEYQDLEDLLVSLQTKVIEPAEQKAQELAKR